MAGGSESAEAVAELRGEWGVQGVDAEDGVARGGGHVRTPVRRHLRDVPLS